VRQQAGATRNFVETARGVRAHREEVVVILVTGNKRLWAFSMAASLIIFAVLYFTVIRPDNNTANQAVKSGLQQSQQVIHNAQKQLKGSGGATKQDQKVLNHAAKLTACLSGAGTDVSKVSACQAKFGG
jgi:hypothetical protein